MKKNPEKFETDWQPVDTSEPRARFKFAGGEVPRDADGKWTKGGGGSKPKSTAEGRAAREEYMSEFGFSDFNDPLREGGKPHPATAALTAEIEASPIAKDTTVFRGMDRDVRKSFQVGTVVTDPAFMSTSTDRRVAESFSEGSNVRTMMTIKAPAGSKGIKGRPDEDELIFQRGSSLVVTKITERKGTKAFDRGVVYVEIEAEMKQ